MEKVPGCRKRGTIIHPVNTTVQLPLRINQLTDFLHDTQQPLQGFPVPAFNLNAVSDWMMPSLPLPRGSFHWLLGVSLTELIARQRYGNR